jgi:hypothetical protein
MKIDSTPQSYFVSAVLSAAHIVELQVQNLRPGLIEQTTHAHALKLRSLSQEAYNQNYSEACRRPKPSDGSKH